MLFIRENVNKGREKPAFLLSPPASGRPIRSAKGSIFIVGRAILDNGNCLDEHAEFQDIHHLVEKLQHADGRFLIAGQLHDQLFIAQSLYREMRCFFAHRNGLLRVGNRIIDVLSKAEPALDPIFGISHIGGMRTFGMRSPIEGISCLPVGTIARFRSGDVSPLLVPLNPPDYSYEDAIHVLQRSMNHYSNEIDGSSLCFTGGLDSTAILCAATRSKLNISAVYFKNEYAEGEDESAIAQSASLDFGIQTSIYNNEPAPKSDRFVGRFDIPCDMPEDIDALGGQFYTERANVQAKIITGHGGDHVFCQNPIVTTPLDEWNSAKPISALRTALKLSRLKGHPFPLILKACRARRLLKAEDALAMYSDDGLDNVHPMLSERKTLPGKWEHIRTILLAQETAVTPSQTGRTFQPMLLPGVVGLTFYRPVSALFNSDYDRLSLRRSLWAQSGCQSAWRRSKRPSSSEIFAILSRNQKKLREFLCDGVVVKALELDIEKLVNVIDYNSNVQLNENLSYILNMYTLESLARNIQRFSSHSMSFTGQELLD